MSDTNNIQAGYQPSQPNPALKKLDKLVGTWEVSGGAQGAVTYEWMEGGYESTATRVKKEKQELKTETQTK